MMTRDEVASCPGGYRVNDRGIIVSPGKFENEPWYVVALWDLALNGADAEVETSTCCHAGVECEQFATETMSEEIYTCRKCGKECGAFWIYWFKVTAALVEACGAGFGYPVGGWVGLWESDAGFVRIASTEINPEDA